MSSATSGEIDPREFRNCCGRFATGITIVTAEDEGAVHGMTVNGFMSVSLQPPLIVVSLGHQSRMYALLTEGMYYGVSVLTESQLAFSNHSAGRHDAALEVPFIHKAGTPLLDGALAHLAARVVDIHPAGDHTLYIGQVEYLDYKNGRPLLYYAGGYNQLKADPRADHMMWQDNELFFFPMAGST